MVILALLIIAFFISAWVILTIAPDRLTDGIWFTSSVRDIVKAIKLCRTTGIGNPIIYLHPNNVPAVISIKFIDMDTARISLPLRRKYQKRARSFYHSAFSNLNLKPFETKSEVSPETGGELSPPSITAEISRHNEEFDETIKNLYKCLFKAKDTDLISARVRTVSYDRNAFEQFEKIIDNNDIAFDFVSSTQRFKKSTIFLLKLDRLIKASFWLLFPVIYIASYELFGLNTLLSIYIVLTTLYLLYWLIRNFKKNARNLLVTSLIFVFLASLSLANQNIAYFKFIPSLNALAIIVTMILTVLGVKTPMSASMNNRSLQPKMRSFTIAFLFTAATSLFLLCEWARHTLSTENWVWFFALFRIEFILGLLALVLPTVFFSSLLQGDST